MYLAFIHIHIGSYDIKARRHLACVQNGIAQLGDWRMETWQLALREPTGSLSCLHPPIPELCNAILNTCPCLLAIIYSWDKKMNKYSPTQKERHMEVLKLRQRETEESGGKWYLLVCVIVGESETTPVHHYFHHWCFLWSAPEHNGYAGDLKRHSAQYDVTVMVIQYLVATWQ